MGLLDQVIGSVLGNGTGSGSPLQGVLQSVLSGGYGQGQGQPQGQGPLQGQGSELSGLVSSFEQAGLGHIVQSWIGNGTNQPVSPQQLQNVIGGNQVQDMANQSGMAPQDLLSQLSQHLPELINRLTPNGQLPQGGSISV